MRVTTSCSGRFHIFDQAAELQRHGVLHRLIEDYPKSQTRRWGIPDEKVVALLVNGVLGRIARRSGRVLPPTLQSRFVHLIHDHFSCRLASRVPLDTDILIGLSSFCLEALVAAKKKGAVAIVDHGSLHQRYERRVLQEECARLGVPVEGEVAPDWLIEKQGQEFQVADHVMVLSEAARRSMIAEGIPAAKLFVNPCGVDVTAFRPIARGATQPFRVIYCGAMSPRKGIKYLLEAFNTLNLPDSELWLIGSSPSGVFAERIKGLISGRVKIMGPYPQHQLPDLYSNGSVFVLPSLADGFGMVVPQAMACGLPVIVTDHVGAADVVDEGVNGFVVPAGDAGAIRERLQQLYESPAKRREMSEAAARKAECSLDWHVYGDRLVRFLERCLAMKQTEGQV